MQHVQNKISKNNALIAPLLHLVGILFPHINDDAWSKSHQIWIHMLMVDWVECTHLLLIIIFTTVCFSTY